MLRFLRNYSNSIPTTKARGKYEVDPSIRPWTLDTGFVDDAVVTVRHLSLYKRYFTSFSVVCVANLKQSVSDIIRCFQCLLPAVERTLASRKSWVCK